MEMSNLFTSKILFLVVFNKHYNYSLLLFKYKNNFNTRKYLNVVF
jgi:hypothetical protein